MATLTPAQTMTVLTDLEGAVSNAERGRGQPIAEVRRMFNNARNGWVTGNFPDDMMGQVVTFLRTADQRLVAVEQRRPSPAVIANRRVDWLPPVSAERVRLIDGSGRGNVDFPLPSSRPQDDGKVQIHIDPQIREVDSKAPPAAEASDEAAPLQAGMFPFSIGLPWIIGISALVVAWWAFTKEEN